MAKRYKDPIAGKIIQIISDKFGNFVQNIDEHDYIHGIESIFNQDERNLKKFAFKLFDTNADGIVSDNDMFEVMKLCNGIKTEPVIQNEFGFKQ